ncbi:MAG: excinuclease ABC subunit UvrC [Ruminococcus sp.]|nr:excinuclease ABC subunit UvrC [Ruminococcus sp.]
MNERLPFLREKVSKLTSAPGVYRMRDKNNKIIYIGKAKNLKNRVTSYFRDTEHTPKVEKMVSLVYDFDFIATKTEYEALVLECSLIKQEMPKYNIKLKDVRGYSYIRLSDGLYPRFSAVMNEQKPGEYFGPYMSHYISSQTVREINRVFLLPTCKRRFPEDFAKGRTCLNFHINLCMGVCTGKIPADYYAEIIADAKQYIKDGSETSVERLTSQMEKAAEELDFERAALLRNRIAAVKKAAERQYIIDDEMKDTDVIALSRNGSEICAAVLCYRNGRLVDRGEYFLGEAETVSDMYEDFILEYYTFEPENENEISREIPREIITADDLENAEILEQLLRERAAHAVDLSNRKRGRGAKLLELAKANASDSLALKLGRTGKEVNALEELQKLLGLGKTPEIIESYDISNTGSQTMVAGMVVFENGRPAKKFYKKFSIKTQAIQNDYGSMAEVIERRFRRYLDEDEKDEGFKRLPDLILLDGGIGQVNAVKPILSDLGLDIPLFGMVKDGKHRTRAIATGGGEIAFPANKSAFFLVTQIQDEVHRFSITYQRSKHKKESLSIGLTAIKGIGEKKAAKLLNSAKTKIELKALTADDIAKILGVKSETAEAVHDYISEI